MADKGPLGAPRPFGLGPLTKSDEGDDIREKLMAVPEPMDFDTTEIDGITVVDRDIDDSEVPFDDPDSIIE